MPIICVHRGTLWNRRVTLSPREAPRGSWTPRNPSALSALSTRPPYSEWTPLPPDLWPLGLVSPLLLPLLLCAFHCDSASLWAGPLPSPVSPQPSLVSSSENNTTCSSLMLNHFLLIISATVPLYQPSFSWYHSHSQPATHLHCYSPFFFFTLFASCVQCFHFFPRQHPTIDSWW